MMFQTTRAVRAAIFLAMGTLFSMNCSVYAKMPPENNDRVTLQQASLEECLQAALENNHQRPASRYAVEMAEARHRQALAGYWPQVSLKGGYQRMDEYSNFIFPPAKISLPMGGTIPDHNSWCGNHSCGRYYRSGPGR